MRWASILAGWGMLDVGVWGLCGRVLCGMGMCVCVRARAARSREARVYVSARVRRARAASVREARVGTSARRQLLCCGLDGAAVAVHDLLQLRCHDEGESGCAVGCGLPHPMAPKCSGKHWVGNCSLAPFGVRWCNARQRYPWGDQVPAAGLRHRGGLNPLAYPILEGRGWAVRHCVSKCVQGHAHLVNVSTHALEQWHEAD
jgi:hypothetical protein